MAVSEIFELGELFDWLINGLAGWRYLFSRSYRQQLHQQWSRQSRWRVVGDVTWKSITFLFTLFLISIIGFILIEVAR
ncbi:MAG: hypothetical protein U0Z53_01535 [Blastocatellia bacterium]